MKALNRKLGHILKTHVWIHKIVLEMAKWTQQCIILYVLVDPWQVGNPMLGTTACIQSLSRGGSNEAQILCYCTYGEFSGICTYLRINYSLHFQIRLVTLVLMDLRGIIFFLLHHCTPNIMENIAYPISIYLKSEI